MPNLNVQFHMLLDESIDFLSDVRAHLSLGIELEQWHPKEVHAVLERHDLATQWRKFGRVDRVWLLFTPRKARRAVRFMLNVGGMRGKRLAQSQFGGGTDNIEAFLTLKKLAANLKRRTTTGVWVTSISGHVGRSRTYRISPAAASAARCGDVELADIAFAGQTMSPDGPEL
jgi:hypothetical protein